MAGQLAGGTENQVIRRCNDQDFDAIWTVINDAAQVYEGVIPSDRWSEPYMSKAELAHEIAEGVTFWAYDEDHELIGVMGIQDVGDVTLIRHAYVDPARQRQGIGGRLLSHLCGMTERPMLIGTWADAVWAIRFYQTHGFRIVPSAAKDQLLRSYWSIPERQVETSVVLADSRWSALERSEAQDTPTPDEAGGCEIAPPERLIQPCGADCRQCETYQQFLPGIHSGLVNLKTGYRCCWLPPSYRDGRECPIKVCCNQHAVTFCGECPEFERCERMNAFYAQPGYDALRRRMLEAMKRRSGPT